MISQQNQFEKIIKYNEDEWKINITSSDNSFSLIINNSSQIYQNIFDYEYLHSFLLFQESKNMKDIIDLIFNLIEEKKFKIEEYNKNISIIFISNISNFTLFLFQKENNLENIVNSLFDEINKMKKEMKELINEEKNEIKKIK